MWRTQHKRMGISKEQYKRTVKRISLPEDKEKSNDTTYNNGSLGFV